jgi:hypothetical protein
MKIWKLTRNILGVVLLVVYLSGPIIAGVLQSGDRLGPKIYSQGLHEFLYIIAHESVHGIKPRVPIDSVLYNRPWFYGQSRIPKSPEQRQAIIQRARENQSPMLSMLEERNRKIDEANKRLETTR